MNANSVKESLEHSRSLRVGLWTAGLLLLYGVYVFGIWENPPGFFIDESALSYNGYLVSQTGAGEFGSKFPLYFQIYTGGFTQWSNPTHIYLLAAAFKVFGPGILTARLFAAFWVFAASILLGLLARRITGRDAVGIIIGGAALATPWLFEISRLVLETFFYPMATVLLLWAVYRVSRKDAWTWLDAAAVAGSLVVLTYSYTIGRMLGPALAAGLAVFITSRKRAISVAKVWAMFLAAFIPLVVYIRQNPDLTTRFYLISYIKQDSTYGDILSKFIVRFLEDINPLTLLLAGDPNPRHHLPGVYGSFYIAVFGLAVIGIVIIIARHRRDSWWLYVLFGLLVSVVPGSLTADKLHTLRMLAYPVFLLTAAIPGVAWLLSRGAEGSEALDEPDSEAARPSRFKTPRAAILAVILGIGVAEAAHFHYRYYMDGPARGYVFDEAYKPLYDQAVAQPLRPIYLVDGYWGPAYIHSFWYATLERRDRKEFIHQPYGKPPPPGVIVLSTEQACTSCEMIRKNGDYLLYRTR